MAADTLAAAQARAAEVARASYGRLLALLAARARDIAVAEEALGDAFCLALETWPTTGIPANPEAWLMATAKNRSVDAFRRINSSPVEYTDELPDAVDEIADPQDIPDRRLALMFVCAHPAIDASLHTALMLQTVLGFEAADIGRSFLVSPTALQQRLVRAKRKIKDSRIPFAMPDLTDMPERLTAVLEAIYGAYALEWLGDVDGIDAAGEALYLARLLASLMPDDPEASGLAAFLCISNARRGTRIVGGHLVPLHEQDHSTWSPDLLKEGDAWLRRASAAQRLGRFQLEAAIQQAHVSHLQDQIANWAHILMLSEGLCLLCPTAGAHVNRIAALAEVRGPRVALDELEKLSAALEQPFQPLEATRANLLQRLGLRHEAVQAYERAISLSTEAPVRSWLQAQQAALSRAGW
jgi:RNA polymerase sigma-70 factor, ECF subfamily